VCCSDLSGATAISVQRIEEAVVAAPIE